MKKRKRQPANRADDRKIPGKSKRIPEWADQWIVFALVFTLGVDDLARSTGLPVGPVEYVLVPLVGASLVVLVFWVWRAVCRRVARLFGLNASPHRISLISNVVFFTVLALMVLQPLIFPHLTHGTMTIELPKKVSIR